MKTEKFHGKRAAACDVHCILSYRAPPNISPSRFVERSDSFDLVSPLLLLRPDIAHSNPLRCQLALIEAEPSPWWLLSLWERPNRPPIRSTRHCRRLVADHVAVKPSSSPAPAWSTDTALARAIQEGLHSWSFQLPYQGAEQLSAGQSAAETVIHQDCRPR